MKKTIAAIALAATIGLFGFQNADAQRGHQGWGGGPAAADCIRAGQNSQVMDAETKKIYNTFMDATYDLRKDMFSLREQMRALRFAETPDQKAIDAVADQMFDLRNQIQAKAEEVGWQGGGAGYGCNFDCDGPGAGMGAGCGKGMARGYGRHCNGPGTQDGPVTKPN
ncbi:MAG: periplasmic heavy metal sensor [Pseudomonadota bacterium]